MTTFESIDRFLARGGVITLVPMGKRCKPIKAYISDDSEQVEQDDDSEHVQHGYTPCGNGYQRARCRGAQ